MTKNGSDEPVSIDIISSSTTSCPPSKGARLNGRGWASTLAVHSYRCLSSREPPIVVSDLCPSRGAAGARFAPSAATTTTSLASSTFATVEGLRYAGNVYHG